MALFPESEELQTPIKTHISSLEHHIIKITYEHLSRHTKCPQNVHINKTKQKIFFWVDHSGSVCFLSMMLKNKMYV